MKAKHWILVIVVLALVVLPVPTLTVAKSNTARSYTILARQFNYTPSIIRVQQGDRVKLTLEAEDVMHGLSLDGYGVNLEAIPRQEKESSAEFVADRAGTFRFRCSITCGAMHPFMIGALVVEPNPAFPIAAGLAFLVAIGTVGALSLRKEKSPTSNPRDSDWRIELTQFKWVKRLLMQRWFQYVFLLLNAFFFVIIFIAAFLGTPVGNANFAIIFVWIVWWVLLIALLIPIGGRIWCMMCPLPAPGEWIERRAFVRKGLEKPLAVAVKLWPRKLNNIWLQNVSFLTVALFSAIILTRPAVTGIVLLLFVAIAIGFSWVGGKRLFCRYICPVGGFIGLYSMVAPVELRVKDPDVCAKHGEKECIRGSESGYGCPWLVYPGTLVRNTYCGLCTECLKTCTMDNIAVNVRPFGADLFVNKGRGLDESFKAFIMLACAAIYSAVFLGPWGFLKDWANISSIPEFLLYAVMFLGTNLVLIPGSYYLAVWAAKTIAEGRAPARHEALAILDPLRAILNRLARRPVAANARHAQTSSVGHLPALPQLFVDYAYALVPMGLAAWIAFSISFMLVNISYAIPLLSDPFGWGWNLLGTATWPWTPYFPELVPYIQVPILLVGLALSIITAYQIARPYASDKTVAIRSVAPVSVFLLGITMVFFLLYM